MILLILPKSSNRKSFNLKLVLEEFEETKLNLNNVNIN